MVPTRLLRGGAVGFGATVLFGVLTGLIPNPVFARMVPRRPLDYLFLVTTAGLLGVYVAQRGRRDGDDGIAAVGTIGGLLAFGCPVCNALLLALASSSAIMTYFDPLRPLFGAVAVGLLGGLVYRRHTRECQECQPTPRQAGES